MKEIFRVMILATITNLFICSCKDAETSNDMQNGEENGNGENECYFPTREITISGMIETEDQNLGEESVSVYFSEEYSILCDDDGGEYQETPGVRVGEVTVDLGENIVAIITLRKYENQDLAPLIDILAYYPAGSSGVNCVAGGATTVTNEDHSDIRIVLKRGDCPVVY
jgi:hypothetical protein